MLTIFTGEKSQACDGLSRRDFLQAGTLALGGLSLPQLLAARASGAESYLRDKSVVLLYLSGGASHIETFDPKMTAPAETRSMTGELSTSLPGVTFGGTFERLAKRADRMSVVRSFSHPVGDHVRAHVHVLTGGTDTTGNQDEGYGMGAMYARLRGTNHEASGLPTYMLLTEPEVDGQYRKEIGRVRLGSQPRELGPAFGPFEHQTTGSSKSSRKSREGSLADNMQLSLPANRFDDRMLLLRQLDRLNRQRDGSGMMDGVDKFNSQAVNLLNGGAAAAFDFRQEDRGLIDRYDTSGIKIGHKQFRRSTLGHQMLVARRLCEAGAGFVTVHSAGWDMHADNNNPGVVKGMGMLGTTLDIAVSAFLDDVRQRGLEQKILLVITGDFGRTPRVNKKGGRDHWARLGTLAFAGGGLNMGQVVGQSTRDAGEPLTDPISARHLLGTVMHTVFDIGTLRLDSGLPRELSAVAQNSPTISELF